MAASGWDAAVRCRAVRKQYGSGAAAVEALRGVDLDVHRGELLMLTGPSGCGKTTLISIVSGILDRDAGECEVLGRDLGGVAESERASFRGRVLGFVFQAFNLLPALTAAENVAVPLLLNGLPRRRALERAAAMLDRVGLKFRCEARPGELSGGQQQLVSIARALVHEPRLVVADEPTSNLDHSSGLKVMEVLRGAARGTDRTLIVVTHDERIQSFADRIVHMEDGVILDSADGDRER